MQQRSNIAPRAESRHREWQCWNECWQQLQYTMEWHWNERWEQPQWKCYSELILNLKQSTMVLSQCVPCMLTVVPSLGAMLLFALLPRTPHVWFYCKAFNISTVMLLWSRTWGAQAQTRHPILGEVFGSPSTSLALHLHWIHPTLHTKHMVYAEWHNSQEAGSWSHFL